MHLEEVRRKEAFGGAKSEGTQVYPLQQRHPFIDWTADRIGNCWVVFVKQQIRRTTVCLSVIYVSIFQLFAK